MKKHLFPITLIVLTLLAWLICYPNLPNEVPIHWGANGEVNGYASKLSALLIMAGLMIFIYILLSFLPKIDPRKENYKHFNKTYNIILNSILLLFFGINLLVLLSALGYDIPMRYFGPIAVGVIFMILGNFMQRVRSNFFIGIRTPWTLSSDEVWKKTHRFSGKLYFIGGLIMICTIFAPEKLISPIMFTIIIIIALLPCLYSYFLFKKKV